MRNSQQYIARRAPEWRASWLLIFQFSAYVDLGPPDILSANIRSADFAKKYADGGWPTDSTWLKWRRQTDEQGRLVRGYLLHALMLSVALFGSALLVAVATGAVAPSLPVQWSKVATVAGGFLASWATIFALGRPEPTWGGSSLAERVPPKIFLAIFCPGVLLSYVGALL